MDPKRRRELALGGVAVLLIAIAAWSMQRSLIPASGAVAPVAANATAASSAPKNPIPEIDLNALEVQRTEPDDSTRNPFRFKPKPVIPAMPSAAVVKQQQAAAAAEAASAPLEPPPPGVVTPGTDGVDGTGAGACGSVGAGTGTGGS